MVLILLDHEVRGQAARSRHLIGQAAQQVQQSVDLFGRSGIGSSTHVLYNISANFFASCTNFFQISSPVSRFVVDEATNPAVEIVRSSQAGQFQKCFYACVLTNVLGCIKVAAASVFGMVTEGGPVLAKQTFERFGVTG